jgi:hypothetical protein
MIDLKNCIKVLTLAILLTNANFAFAQKKKKDKKETTIKETIRVDDDEVYEVMEVQEVVNVSDSYNRLSSDKINEDTKWVYSKYRSSDRKYGISKRGKMILPMLFSRQIYNKVSGDNAFCMGIGANYGLYNIDKEIWEIPMMYATLKHLGNDIFLARAKSGYYGLINRSNEVLIPFEWGEISRFEGIDNYYLIHDKKNSLRGVYSLLRDQFVISCEYKSFSKIRNDNLYKVNNNKGYNLITIDNKAGLKNWYQELHTIRDSKNFIVKLNDKMGIIDENENIIVPIEYQNIRVSRYNDGSYLAINKDGKYGCITANGEISLPFEYDFINTSYSNSLTTRKGDKCGMIQVNNGSPHEIVTCEYDAIIVDKESLIVKKKDKFGILDSYGKLIAPCEYESIEKVLFKNYSSNYIYLAKKDNKYTILDKGSREITAKGYDLITPIVSLDIRNSYYNTVRKCNFLLFKDKAKLGVLDMLGKEVLETKYDDITGEFNNMIIVKNKNKVGIYNLLTKRETTACIYDQIIIDKTGNYGTIGTAIYKLNLADNTKSIKM